MKKIVFLLFIFSLYLIASVGKVAAIYNEAFIVRSNAQIKAVVGTTIEEKDKIFTTKNSRAQLLFADKSVITLGSDSSFEVQEYSAAEGKESVKFNVATGFFKAVTGAVGKANPSNFKLSTKTATIGIRGTHILGFVADEYEKIACVGGAISVAANGGVVELVQGQLTELFKNEPPKNPRELSSQDLKEFKQGLGLDGDLMSKISAIRLDKDKHTPSKEQFDEIMSKINEIQNNELRLKALDALESALNNQLDELYAGKYFKLDASQILDSNDKNSIKIGYYTDKQVQLVGSTYLVDGKSYDSLVDAVNAAVPREMYREPDFAVTNPADVAKKMGGDSSNVRPAWDGRSSDRFVATYEGKSIGLSKENGASTAFLQNADNKAKLTIDYGNRTVLGTFAYDVVGTDGKVHGYKQIVADAGKELVVPSSFFADSFAVAAGSSKFLATQMFYGRYYWPGAAQISSYFESLANDIDVKNPAYDRDMLGLMTLTKTDEYKLSKVQKGEDAAFSWGYWAKSGFVESSIDSILSAKPSGGWIAPKEGITESTNEAVAALKTQQLKASYQAELVGTVNGYDGSTSLIRNGKMGLNIDFGKSNLTGQMSFDAGKDKWALQMTDGSVKDNGFSVSKFKTDSTSTVQIKEQQITGSFFGPKAEFVGGGFSLVGSGSQVAVGALKGAR